jgi:hypothetical protein
MGMAARASLRWRATHQFEYAQPLPRRRGGVILPTPVKNSNGF